MNYKTYFRNLDESAREAHAKKAGTTADYINIHLIPKRKIPRKELMQALADASGGQCSYRDLIDYFYLDEEEVAA